jgi:hypothetical protein
MTVLVACVWFGAVFYLSRKTLLAQALSTSFKASVVIAKTALRDFNPDVVVGFSWGKSVHANLIMACCLPPSCNILNQTGGAITIELIRNGDWQGSTVLLAPAHKLLDGLMQRKMPLPALDETRTIVVHSTGDTLVPIADSEELEQVTEVRLIRVASEPHKMWAIAADGLLQKVVSEAGEAGRI